MGGSIHDKIKDEKLIRKTHKYLKQSSNKMFEILDKAVKPRRHAGVAHSCPHIVRAACQERLEVRKG